MYFSTGALLSLGLATVHGLPLSSSASSGCRVELSPTLSQPQNAASNILFHTLSKWVNTTKATYFSSNYLDTQNTTKAPFSVVFKADMIPDFQTDEAISSVLDTWVGTYLVGGATPSHDDYAITGVTCF
ncbi:hypothetical protein ONZ43_g5585 [Nemania bipapillata]|uniref:Uncharacterized protein n=1 Tax=Nemania bipapillata TaxID=110536 RepID=A0ACC2I8S7_9PEZI|nr:hypothetical protein ONZ43_g5585 [Nemania bipapillata]